MKHIHRIKTEKIGIMPIGALNISLASYLDEIDIFIESRKIHYGIGKKLKIYLQDDIKKIILTEENYTSKIESLIFTGLPEIILFSPPNHRLVPTLDEVIDVIGLILNKIQIIDAKEISDYIPKFVMLSNGIYYDNIVNYLTNIFDYVEYNIRKEIIGNFIRATTHQTGIRIEDEDSIVVFKPGTKGSITVAGGSKWSRERVIELFVKDCYPVFDEGSDYKKIEFDKAIINLSGNGVQLSMLYNEDSKVHIYTLGDLVSDQTMREMSKKIIYTMVSIGVKAGIYKSSELESTNNKGEIQKQLIDSISQAIWKYIESKSIRDNKHIFSTIANVIGRYKYIKPKSKHTGLPPLEENIINYLLNLSNENNLMEEKRIIEELRDSILKVCEKMRC